MNPCTAYSDRALNGIVRDLSLSRQWPQRLKLAIAEKKRREREEAATGKEEG